MFRVVTAALDAGYRSFDSAKKYGNEQGLGLALTRSGIPREEVFVTTKLWSDDQGHDAALRAFDTSFNLLGLDYVDLYLIHLPAPSLGLYVETWLALEEIYRSDRVRAIGVANFAVHHIEEILKVCSIVPAVNQVELHPRLQQKELRALHADHGIATEAWGPLARGLVLDHPSITSIAARHDATPAQIVLRWHLQNGTIVIPKSKDPVRTRQNLEAAALAPLDEEELAEIDALDVGARTGPDFEEFIDGTEGADVYQPRFNEMIQQFEESRVVAGERPDSSGAGREGRP